MSAEIWASVATVLATLLLFIVPALIYTWYLLEDMIGDKESYESVIAECRPESRRGRRPEPDRPSATEGRGS